MDNNVKTWLYDVLNAINEIDSFFVDRPKDFERSQNDLRTEQTFTDSSSRNKTIIERIIWVQKK